jgi:hypothetical protein
MSIHGWVRPSAETHQSSCSTLVLDGLKLSPIACAFETSALHTRRRMWDNFGNQILGVPKGEEGSRSWRQHPGTAANS